MHFSHFNKTCELHNNKRVKENVTGNMIDNDNVEIISLGQFFPKMVLKFKLFRGKLALMACLNEES